MTDYVYIPMLRISACFMCRLIARIYAPDARAKMPVGIIDLETDLEEKKG
jgi:hypothetical protein